MKYRVHSVESRKYKTVIYDINGEDFDEYVMDRAKEIYDEDENCRNLEDDFFRGIIPSRHYLKTKEELRTWALRRAYREKHGPVEPDDPYARVGTWDGTCARELEDDGPEVA